MSASSKALHLHPCLPNRLAFLDLETTGMSAERDRITEIGVLLVEDGELVQEWSSLIQPGVRVPPAIRALTGISDAMLQDAPRFADIAETLAALLHGCTVVAHNARFDYGFLRAEFERFGIRFSAPVLCTVRLSRALYPDRGSHGLDSLIARFRLPQEVRHRALGDARVLLPLLQRMANGVLPDEFERAVAVLLQRPLLPASLPPGVLETLPRGPGVYLFRDEGGQLLYVGKSVQVRERVASHFTASVGKSRSQRMLSQVASIEAIPTAGEFGALLIESALVKQASPSANIRLRERQGSGCLLRMDSEGWVERRSLREWVAQLLSDASELHADEHFGVFESVRAARERLADLARTQRLCTQRLGIDIGSGITARARRGKAAGNNTGKTAAKIAANKPCFGRQLNQCDGVCVGVISGSEHAARLRQSLTHWRMPVWPLSGPGWVLEKRDIEDNTGDAAPAAQWHVFDRWCYLGSVSDIEAVQALIQNAERRFDIDAFRLLQTWMGEGRVSLLGV